MYLVGIGFLSISRRTKYAKFLLTKASDGDPGELSAKFLLTKASDGDRNVKVFAISVV